MMMQRLKQAAYALFRQLPVNKSVVLFFSYYGSSYSCNPKYISEYLEQRRDKDIKIVWAFTDKKNFQPRKGIKNIRYGSLEFYYYLAIAGAIVTNYRMTTDFHKGPGQLYMQTWHSSLRLKMIERDVEQTLKTDYVKMAKNDSAQIDVLLSGCHFSTEIFKRAFWYDGQIAETGTPRIDRFVNPSVEDRNQKAELCSQLGIPADTKLLLYAPTFRENHGMEAYDIDFRGVVESLTGRFGGRWAVLVRLHPHLQHSSAQWCRSLGDDIHDVTTYGDVQNLLAVSDALISDYSSLVFDFAYTGRPIWLYASDYADYKAKERGLYFTIDQLPFSMNTSNAALIEEISRFCSDQYSEAIAKFMATTGSCEDGHAAERAVALLCKELKK